jgi:hypothetical protein
MNGIYSQPLQYPTQPENAMRARHGLRPLCYDRPDFPPPMSPDCKAWAVRSPDEDVPGDNGENPATESTPARESWRCLGCRHLPNDPRVIERANESEAV